MGVFLTSSFTQECWRKQEGVASETFHYQWSDGLEDEARNGSMIVHVFCGEAANNKVR